MTKFVKGQSGNPNGRPARTITSILESHADKKVIKIVIEYEQDGEIKTKKLGIKSKQTLKELIALQMLIRAANGDPIMIDKVYDRLEGKPTVTAITKSVDDLPSPPAWLTQQDQITESGNE